MHSHQYINVSVDEKTCCCVLVNIFVLIVNSILDVVITVVKKVFSTMNIIYQELNTKSREK